MHQNVVAASLPSHQIRVVPVVKLRPAPYNPRKIDRAAMAGLTKSMERFGDVQPIVWNERSGYIVGGHQRLKVLKRKKVQEVAVVVVDLDDTEEKALNVALNNPHVAGEFTDGLAALLAEIQADDAALFSDLRFDALLAEATEPLGLVDPDLIPATPQDAGYAAWRPLDVRAAPVALWRLPRRDRR